MIAPSRSRSTQPPYYLRRAEYPLDHTKRWRSRRHSHPGESAARSVDIDSLSTMQSNVVSILAPDEIVKLGQRLQKIRTEGLGGAQCGTGVMSKKRSRAWYLLLLLPFFALLAPVYLRSTPALAGIPFFYWYQFAVLAAAAGLTAFVYVVMRKIEP